MEVKVGSSSLIDDPSLTSEAPFMLVSALGNKNCGGKDRRELGSPGMSQSDHAESWLLTC